MDTKTAERLNRSILQDPNAYYEFGAKTSMAQVLYDVSDRDAYDRIKAQMRRGERLPDDFVFPGEIYIGSPKEKAYDMADRFVSESLAAVIRKFGGPDVRLFPLNIKPYPKSGLHARTASLLKFPLSQPYYLLEVPVVSCLHYQYGEEMPTYEGWRQAEIEFHKVNPETYPNFYKAEPILAIWANLEKVKHLPLFSPAEYPYIIFASTVFIAMCKKAGIWGINHRYSLNESLELTRKIKNRNIGLPHLLYQLRVV